MSDGVNSYDSKPLGVVVRLLGSGGFKSVIAENRPTWQVQVTFHHSGLSGRRSSPCIESESVA